MRTRAMHNNFTLDSSHAYIQHVILNPYIISIYQIQVTNVLITIYEIQENQMSVQELISLQPVKVSKTFIPIHYVRDFEHNTNGYINPVTRSSIYMYYVKLKMTQITSRLYRIMTHFSMCALCKVTSLANNSQLKIVCDERLNRKYDSNQKLRYK